MRSAGLYDLLYANRDYAADAVSLYAILERIGIPPGARLLDVACGTGRHIEQLREHYEVAGVDVDEDMLEIARGRNPGVPFYLADMGSFQLGRRFDAVICLGGSIAAARTPDGLRAALAHMAAHLVEAGVVLMEPWLEPQVFEPGRVDILTVEGADIKVVRMGTGRLEGNVDIITLHYLAGRAGAIEHFTEEWALGLFSRQDLVEAFRAVGLEVVYDSAGISGHGLYVGRKPPHAPTL